MEGIVVGNSVMAYRKGKWVPSLLVELGRKWATIRVNGKNYNSKVPITAIKEMPVRNTNVSIVKKDAPIHGWRLERDQSYFKIKDGDRMVAVIPAAYSAEAEAMFNAVKNV